MSTKSSLRCRNPTVSGGCPFLLHYERKSQIIDCNNKLRAAAVNDATG